MYTKKTHKGGFQNFDFRKSIEADERLCSHEFHSLGLRLTQVVLTQPKLTVVYLLQPFEVVERSLDCTAFLESSLLKEV
ncbi:MAG: hypothetical protein RMX65_020835 [Nostoc sp. DedQUE01]